MKKKLVKSQLLYSYDTKNVIIRITPDSLSKSYSKKVWWKCKNGHEFERHIYNQRKAKKKSSYC